MSDTLKCAIYCRVASVNEFNIDAIKMQEEMLRNYATKVMFSIVGIYSDNGASGQSFDRTEFQKMMFAVNNGEINCIIAKDTCRISRNYLQFGKWLDDMRGKNVRVIAVNDNFDSKNHDDQIVSFADAIDKYYKESHSQRIKAGIALARQRKLEQTAKLSE